MTHSVQIRSMDVTPEAGAFPPVASSRKDTDACAARPSGTTAAGWSLAGAVGQWWRARTQPARHMRLVETLTIGPKRSVALLELDGRRFLIGMGNDGVTTMLQVEGNQHVGDRLS